MPIDDDIVIPFIYRWREFQRRSNTLNVSAPLTAIIARQPVCRVVHPEHPPAQRTFRSNNDRCNLSDQYV